MTTAAGIAKVQEALDLLRRASLLLLAAGEMTLVAHVATPIDLIEERLQRTIQ